MKKTFYTICVVLFAVLTVFAKSKVLSQHNENPPLTLTIKSDKQLYEEGEPILITVTVKNISNQKVSIFIRYLTLPSYLLQEGICDVFNSKKERIFVGVPMQPAAAKKNDFMILEPGKSASYKFNLYDAPMDQLKPEAYTIKYFYYGTESYYEDKILKKVNYPWTGTVTSNEIYIQVVEKGALTAVKKTWDDLLTALKSNDENKIKALSTKKGYEYLSSRKESFKEIGDSWSSLKLRWKNMTEVTAWASHGAEIKEPGISFVKVNGEWKFDHLTSGE